MLTKQDIPAFCETNRILLRQDAFVYLLPHPALRDRISNYTLTFPSKEIIPERYTVIPHGSATLVYGRDGRGTRGSLFGPITRPCPVGERANQSEMLFIIEFQPGGLFAFTGIRQRELTDQILPFEAVNPALDRALLEALERAGSLEELVGLADRRLAESLLADCPSQLQAAARLLAAEAGKLSCQELSAAVYYSQRHLGRLFEHHVGMSPKTLSRIIRVNRSIRLLHNPRCSITRACLEAGFYDLPHFIHAFRAVCGTTPQAYRSSLSDFYSEIAKF